MSGLSSCLDERLSLSPVTGYFVTGYLQKLDSTHENRVKSLIQSDFISTILFNSQKTLSKS